LPERVAARSNLVSMTSGHGEKHTRLDSSLTFARPTVLTLSYSDIYCYLSFTSKVTRRVERCAHPSTPFCLLHTLDYLRPNSSSINNHNVDVESHNTTTLAKMASAKQTTKSPDPAETVSSPARVNPFLGTFPPPDPNKKIKKFTPAEIDLALCELTLEAAWEVSKVRMEEAETAAERREVRRKHMNEVLVASNTAHSKIAAEIVDARIYLLEMDWEVSALEEKYWYSRF